MEESEAESTHSESIDHTALNAGEDHDVNLTTNNDLELDEDDQTIPPIPAP